MGATVQAYVNMMVRIIEGAGEGQERQIASNDATTITTSLPWTTVPDKTSQFVISEASWKFGAVSVASPAKFQLPYRAGTVLQISGRAANVLNQESSPDLCPLTRISLGGQEPDFGVPGLPAFTLNAPGSGELTLSGVGFTDTKNVGSVTSGTLSLYFIDELAGPSSYALSAAIDAEVATLPLNRATTDLVGTIVQIGTELVSVLSVDVSAGTCTVLRGILNSTIGPHTATESLVAVQRSVIIVPFAINFFENRASINYLHSFVLPDTRITASEFFVTNSFGNSQVQQQCYTELPDRGMRTLSGGQFALQINGSITTQVSAAPPLVIQADHAVRDIRADLGRAAQGYNLAVQVLQEGQAYCLIQIASNDTVSALLDGVDLPALRKLSPLNINVSLQPVDGFQGTPVPPKDLTVTIRL